MPPTTASCITTCTAPQLLLAQPNPQTTNTGDLPFFFAPACRFAVLTRKDPQAAEQLHRELDEHIHLRQERLVHMAEELRHAAAEHAEQAQQAGQQAQQAEGQQQGSSGEQA